MYGNEELATWPSQSRIREINADALLPFPFYSAQNPVPFPAADRSHLRKSWFISAQDSRPPFIIVGKSWQQELKDVVTSQTCPEACPLGESGSCQVDNHSSPSQASWVSLQGVVGESVSVTQFCFVSMGSGFSFTHHPCPVNLRVCTRQI